MTEINKEFLHRRTTIRRVLQCMRAGLKKLRYSVWAKVIMTIYCILSVLVILGMALKFGEYSFVLAIFNVCGRVLFAVIGATLLIYLFGAPLTSQTMQNNLTRAGFYNAAGETPLLLKKEKDKKNPNCFYLYFDSVGLTYSYWVEHTELLQNALNIVIGGIEWGDSQRQVILHCTSGSYKFPQQIIWEDKYLANKEGVLALGMCATGIQTLDLNVFPHILLAGSTGSGKSVILRVLLWQCIQLDYKVLVADLKGGVDFMSDRWRGKLSIYDELDAVNSALNYLTGNLAMRKNMFLATACANIRQYNKKHPENPYRRIIFFIDELAELLDKTGLTKEQKAQIDEIERKLVTVIRLGRAFGIHCIMATQRPDSEILRGQIRSNIDARFCSRCDSTLSILMLGDSEAATRIPKNELGLFMGTDKILFKSFILDEDISEPSET